MIALVLVANGAIQNFSGYSIVHTLTNGVQTIAQGPVASQEAIKDLGTNGGGFFNANTAHPFENPNGFTNALEIFICLLIPFGLAITFGKWVGNVKQGIALGAVMGIILIGAFGVAAWQEQQGNPALVGTGATQVATSAVWPAATWKARRPASGRSSRRSTTPPRRAPAPAPSTRRMTAARRSAGWCRWCSSSSVRSPRAMSVPASTAWSCSPSSRCSSRA